MQSKSTFPARIARFSVPEALPFSRVGKVRFERETWTYFALLYLHNGRGKNQRSTEINWTGLLYVHIDFEAIWTFLQGATWILNPSGYCALQGRQGARVRHQSRFS